MKNQLNIINNLINNLSTRERVLVLVGLLSIIYLIWDTLLIAPLQKNNIALNTQFQSIKTQVADLEKRRKMASDRLGQSRRKELLKEIALLEHKITDFDTQISARLKGRVAPEEMLTLLNDVLKKNQALELLQIRNIPAELFISKQSGQKKNTETKELDPELVGIYRHSMELELQGSYLDILDYLQQLETLKWKIFWDEVKMDVQEYPIVKVYIKVHTFSLKDGWLGV